MMRSLLLLVSVLLLVTCNPSQNDPRFGTVTIGFGPSIGSGTTLVWRSDQLAAMRGGLRALSALGPTCTEASEGAAQYVVRPYDSHACALGAARWTPGTAYVEIDPASPCTNGLTELRTAMMHEIGHILGLGHVCIEAGELPDCSPVGVGPAVMNPQVSYGDAVDPSRYTGVGTDTVTNLDIAEYNRTHP